MEENTIEAVIRLRDEMSGNLDKAQDNLKKVADSFTKVGKQMMASGAAMGAAVGFAVKQFYDEEQQVAKLTYILKANAGATDEQVEGLKKQAAELQRVGVVGDETTMALQAQLGTFRLNADTIQKLTPVIEDMAVSQRGANLSIEDMINFGNIFGRAMSGSFGMLSRYGIILDDNTKKVLENGTETEKAAVLIEALRNRFGGLNEQIAKTSAGSFAQLKNTISDLQESIGGLVAPLLLDWFKQLGGYIRGVTEWLNTLSPATKELIGKVMILTPLILTLGGGFLFLTGQLANVGLFVIQAIQWFRALGTAGSVSIGALTTSMLTFIAVLLSAIVLMQAFGELKGFIEAKKSGGQAKDIGAEVDRIREEWESGKITREEAQRRFQAVQTRGAELSERVGRETWATSPLERVGMEIGRFQQVFADIRVTKEDEIGEKINAKLKPIFAGQ